MEIVKPKEIKIELTDRCLRNCIHCSSDAVEKNYFSLEQNLVKKVIDEAVDLDVKSVVFTGGEPMLYQYLTELIKYAKAKGLFVKMYTMCDPNIINALELKKLNLLGLDEIIYSLAYQLTTDSCVNSQNIKSFIDGVINVTKLRIGFHYVITTETINDLSKIVDLVKSFDQSRVNKLSLLRYVPHGRGSKSLEVPIETIRKEVRKIYEGNENLIRLGSPFNILNITHHDCTAARETIIVGVDGNIYPCDAMKYFNYLGSGGNVYKDTLVDAINSKYFKEIRKYSPNINKECEKCKMYDFCQSGCLGQKMICNFNDDNLLTAEGYSVNAIRTMRNFETPKMKRINYKTGLLGETGELFDALKKIYTHGITDDKKTELIDVAKKEIGDIIWYITAPMADSLNFILDDVVSVIDESLPKRTRIIDKSIISYASKSKDPLCPFQITKSLPISVIDERITDDNYDIEERCEDFAMKIANLISCKDREKAIKIAAQVILSLGVIAKYDLGISLEKALKINNYKLKKLYERGFSEETANVRIDSLAQHKEGYDSSYSSQKKKMPNGQV